MNSLQKMLEQYLRKNTVVDIQVYSDPQNTITCLIQQITDKLVCVIEVDEDGTYDGFIVIRLDAIYCIRYDNKELRHIADLVRKRGLVPELPTINLSSFSNVMKDINDSFGYVVISLEKIDREQCYVGTVISIGELVILHEYTPLDEPQRSEVMIRCKDITRVGCGGKYEENLLKEFKASPKLKVVKEIV